MSSPKPRPSTRWFSGWRRAPQPRQPDFADFGTAFGLELSLSQPPDDVLLPATSPTSAPVRGWRHRLTWRRQAAAALATPKAIPLR